MSSQQIWPATAIANTDTKMTPDVSAGDEIIIFTATAHNTSGATRTVEWFLVPSGGTPGAGNRIHKASIATQATDAGLELVNITVVPGAAVYAKADDVGVISRATGKIRQTK